MQHSSYPSLCAIALLLLLLNSFVAASVWDPLADLAGGKLMRRAAETTTDNTASATQTDTNTDKKTSAATTTGTASKTDTKTDTATGTDSDTDTKTNAKHAKTTSVSIDPAAGPGGVSMLTPAATAGETFVKVGTNVTFAWNYTSLTITPTGIDILAWNDEVTRAYTLAANTSVAKTQTVTWDTNQTFSAGPLVNGEYTLMIYDVDTGPSKAVVDAGHLAAYTQFTFGVYKPQAYTPWSSWRCVACNGAAGMNDVARQTLMFALTMAGITIASFTWFVSGLGLF